MRDQFVPVLSVAIDDPRDRKLAEDLFEQLRLKTGDGVGVTRASCGEGESVAIGLVEAKAQALGLQTGRDAGANLVVVLEGSEPSLPFLACGSHLDSVPQGGNFDGRRGSRTRHSRGL
jgi:beta-ureidopropionase / N-carbamoyl-L-amino-acid hydrolase